MSEGETKTEETYSQQAPASNPGSDDPSAGIATGSGGVSSAAYVHSPVPSEQKSVVQTTVDTVRSYLPASLAGLSLGGGSKAEEPEAKSEHASGEKEAAAVGGGTVAATAAAAAAVTTDKESGAAPTDSTDNSKTDTAEETSAAKADSWVPGQEKDADAPPTDKSNEVSDAKADSWAPGQEKDDTAPPADVETKKSETAKDNWTPDQSEGDKPKGNETEGEKSEGGGEPKKATGSLENRDAIPTAGGERLGEKHWGESKKVPDVPQTQSETQVSSEEGQPDKTTQDNTASNTGGAARPGGSGEEEKTSLKDKIKDKLNIGSKD